MKAAFAPLNTGLARGAPIISERIRPCRGPRWLGVMCESAVVYAYEPSACVYRGQDERNHESDYATSDSTSSSTDSLWPYSLNASAEEAAGKPAGNCSSRSAQFRQVLRRVAGLLPLFLELPVAGIDAVCVI